MIDLTGKVILVTGGSRGIGAVIVRTLCRAGAQVILHYGYSQHQAEQLAEELGRERCHPLAADLAVSGVAPTLWHHALAWQGRLDVIVNNAAVIPPASVDDDAEIWQTAWVDTLQVNLIAVADLCREAINYFRANQGGSIINIASRAAFRGDAPAYMHYAASKGGLIALTRSIARGFAKDNILAYAVAPGFVDAGMAYQGDDTIDLTTVIQEIPLGAMAPPEDVAHVVAFLAAGLAPHMTGATVDINGASYVR